MKLPVKDLITQATTEDRDGFLYFDKKKFAELIVRACADHVLESSDRYRKEYFANKILELINE